MVASIEAALTLRRPAMDMGALDAVEFTHVALRPVPEVLDFIDMIALIDKVFAVVDPAGMEVRHIRSVVGAKAIRMDHGVWLHVLVNDGRRRLGSGVWRDDRATPAATPGKPENSSAPAFAAAAETAFIGRDLAMKPTTGGLAGDKPSGAHEKTARGVRSNPNDPGGGAGRAAGHKMFYRFVSPTTR